MNNIGGHKKTGRKGNGKGRRKKENKARATLTRSSERASDL